MINRLLEELKKFLPKAKIPLDPAQFEDSVALKTQWDPLRGGGTNFRTHAMKKVDDNRCVFKTAGGYIAFCALFMAIGLGVTIAILFASHASQFKDYLPLLIGVVFGAVGFCMLYFGGKPVTFDRESGLAWRGWRDPRSDFEHGQEKIPMLCRLDEIHALQIVSEFVKGSKNRSYLSYELNLVMPDGSRLNVVDHGDIARLRLDAAELGLFLEVPVWDATLVEGRGR
jgi:hypothetical protein